MKIHPFLPLLLFGIFASCDKREPLLPFPVEHYRVHIDNEFNELEGRQAIWISDEEGTLRAFRWIPASDTAQIEVPDSKDGEVFDCTVARIFGYVAPGSGIADTTITLTTYTALADGETIHLRNNTYKRYTDLSFSLTGVSSFDSIIVADGLTFARPHSSNNYYGQYQVEHTGRIWFRVLANGDPHWRYLYFDNVNGNTLNLSNVDVNIMTLSFAHPKNVQLPFTAAWKYKVDGVVDLNGLQFLPLGDLRRAPGGAEQVISSLDIFEPVANEDFMPIPKPYSNFRLQMTGTSSEGDKYTFYSDNIYPSIPTQLAAPAFNLEPTTLVGNRAVAARCIGDFDLLSFTRNYTNAPFNITWEVITKPVAGAIVQNRLPDVPKALSDAYLPLEQYNFGNKVWVRAESYSNLNGYEAVLKKRLENADPMWQAKAGYLGREELY